MSAAGMTLVYGLIWHSVQDYVTVFLLQCWYWAVPAAELREEEFKPLYWKYADGAMAFRVPMDYIVGMKHGMISEPYRVG